MRLEGTKCGDVIGVNLFVDWAKGMSWNIDDL